ncbi:hypothetical protein [Jannaschia rubra]|uniref:baeRF3 domain-containing protein n=1 Tax=Jannaschia rubra TaxID=282197 RepID=UPI00249176B2|nr:hypothetical protein [Jannaschia rubra]
MFTKSDLDKLMEATPPVGVSLFLPTHVRGAETRQGPIRLKNLLAEARNRLGDRGMKAGDIHALLAPATALLDDYPFWQHQNEGLALFLGSGGMHEHRVPLSFDERVAIGPRFHVKPLLPLLAADGAFHVLTITAERVRLFDASRFSMAEVELDDAPEDLAEVMGKADYQNPLQAPPATRPGPGGTTISKSEVLGDSPADWRKDRLVEYVRRIASVLDDRLASDAVPVVLVADAETGGHFARSTTLGPLLAGVIETNPAAMDDTALHEAAYALVEPRFMAGRREAVGRLAALQGSDDARAMAGAEDVARSAQEGRVETLLLAEGASDRDGGATGSDDEAEGSTLDRFDAAAVQTLRHGGDVYIVPADDMPGDTRIAAILRY